MLSTAFEAGGLAVITAGLTAGVLVLAGVGWALLALGVVGGGSLLFVGVALSAPEPTKRVRVRVGPLTNDDVEQA